MRSVSKYGKLTRKGRLCRWYKVNGVARLLNTWILLERLAVSSSVAWYACTINAQGLLRGGNCGRIEPFDQVDVASGNL